MAFTIYKSSDASAPSLTNAAGTLITVLDDILRAGYGSKSPAGWTKPYTNSTTQAAFQNASAASPTGTGTGFFLSVDDSADVPTAAGNEARICGFESMSAVGSGMGTGSGQFPYPSAAQYNRGTEVSPYGWVNVRKSKDSSAKNWVAFADTLTLYFFVQAEATATYHGIAFGDFYSLYGTSDNWRCILIGRSTENGATFSGAMDNLSLITMMTFSAGQASVGTHYVAKTYGGGGSGIAVGKHGDLVKAGLTAVAYSSLVMGVTGIQTPNGPDNSYYISPIWVHEPSGSIVRGRMRGLWHLCHPASSFSDGQTFTATGAVAGKTFQVIKLTDGAGCLAIETSDTLEQN
jgi:hypothetical protein